MKRLIFILACLPLLAAFSLPPGPTEKGTEAYTAGRFDDALEHYQKAAQDNPGKAEAHYNLGGAYYKTGQYDKALKEYEEALRLNPKMSEAYYNTGDSLYRMGMFEKALGAYQQADGIKKDDQDTKHNIDIVLAKIKREKQKQQRKQGGKDGQGREKKDNGGKPESGGQNQQGQGQGQQPQGGGGPRMSNEEMQAMLDRQKKEEKSLRNYFRPGKKDEGGREAQIEQMLRSAGMQGPGVRPARPGAPYVEKDW